MKRILYMVMMAVVVLAGSTNLSAQPLSFTHTAVVSNHVSYLSWHSCPDASAYRLYRHYPDQLAFVAIATLADTFYYDTLHRTLCGDTVSYYVEGVDIGLMSSTVGLYFEDNVPTSPCALRLCSVDTLLSRIRLSWYPSPDTDVMGYYICMGVPCRDYDTVWGRLNTEYLCAEQLDESNNVEYSFRILAFDSCYQASPLTPYYHNPQLMVRTEPCSRQLRCSWNRYVNMPDNVGEYCLHYKLRGETEWRVHRTDGSGELSFDTVVSDMAVKGLRAYLSVVSSSDSLIAFSMVHEFDFDYGDTAEYVRIADLRYDENRPAVTLTIETDPDFEGSRCYVYRATGLDEDFEQTAELDCSEQYIVYTDNDISRAAGRYVYRVGVPDICGQRIKYSDTVVLTLPEVLPSEAFFPNAIIYGDSDLGQFCPYYISPLSDGYSLDIYNRIGQRIFHTNNIHDCWNGTDELGSAQTQGVYVYKAYCRHADGSEKVYTGTVLLLK